MPAAQDDGLIWVEPLGVPRDLHGLPDHRSGDQRDREAQRIFQFFEYALAEIRRDRGIDDADLVPARSNGVDTARIPRGAVASWLENAGKKKTTFLDRMPDSPTVPLQS